MKAVHKIMLVLVAALAGTCWGSEAALPSQSEQSLRAIWTATNATPQQRATAVNSFFTNGTPIRRILGVIGKWDEHHQAFTTPDLSEREYAALVYRFGPDRITVWAKGAPDKRAEDCLFVGAFAWTPADSGRRRGAANRGQPVQPETNRTPAAVGPGR